MEQKLEDFTPDQLIGKRVIVDNRRIGTINRVTKKYFSVSNWADDLFELNTGRIRGSNQYHTKWAELISDEEAAILISKWKEQREIKEMSRVIVDKINNKELTHGQISQIINLIIK